MTVVAMRLCIAAGLGSITAGFSGLTLGWRGIPPVFVTLLRCLTGECGASTTVLALIARMVAPVVTGWGRGDE